MSWYDDLSWHEAHLGKFNPSLHETSHKLLINLGCLVFGKLRVYVTFHKYRNIGLLAQISCQLLVCSGKSQLHIILFRYRFGLCHIICQDYFMSWCNNIWYAEVLHHPGQAWGNKFRSWKPICTVHLQRRLEATWHVLQTIVYNVPT